MANVNLSWTPNDASADATMVKRDGSPIASLNPLTASHTDADVAPGEHSYEVCHARGAEIACAAPVAVNVLAAPLNVAATVSY